MICRVGLLGRARGLAALLVLAVASTLVAQEPRIREPGDVELELLRAASVREASGDLAGAERLLRVLLERYPDSAAGLLALERVLRAKGDVRAALPVADALLAANPRSPRAHRLRLRILAELDSAAGVTEAAEGWMRADPRSEDPYREIAAVYESRFGVHAALRVLERGRAAMGDSTALAVEMGELLVRAGRVEEGVREWSRGLGREAQELPAVLRRVASLQASWPELPRRLVDALVAEPTTLARRRAAAQVAVEAKLADRAIEVANGVIAELDGRARYGFLADLARRAEEAGAPRTALWAYLHLRAYAERAAERSALDRRIAAAAQKAGDNRAAGEAWERVAAVVEKGSPERREALVALVRLNLEGHEPEAVRAPLAALRAEFPDASELDRLAAAVAAWLAARGERERAREVLEGIEGPWSTRERAFLLLEAGDVAAGRDQLLAAAAGLAPEEATDVIATVRVLGNVDPASARIVADAVVLAHRGHTREAEERLAARIPAATPRDRPALLALAARLAEQAGRSERALDLRRRIASEFPRAPEAPEAMLLAAQALAPQPGGLGEAVALLERLILTQPQSALVPQARRELERLKGRVPQW